MAGRRQRKARVEGTPLAPKHRQTKAEKRRARMVERFAAACDDHERFAAAADYFRSTAKHVSARIASEVLAAATTHLIELADRANNQHTRRDD